MSRSSSRITLLVATLEIIEKSGLQGLTYESLSTHTGISRSGILYHFPSKEKMIAAAHEYTVQQWNTAAEAHLGTPFEEATPTQRAAAYILAAAEEQEEVEGASHYQDAAHSEFSKAVWREVRTRWIDVTEGVLTPCQHVAVLAAEGLWLDHGTDRMMPQATRELAMSEVLRLVHDPKGQQR